MSDALWSSRRFRTFNVNDDFNRQSLRIEIDASLPSQRVIRVLDEFVAEVRGMSEDGHHRYNPDRSHRSLGGLSPIRYAMASSITFTSE